MLIGAMNDPGRDLLEQVRWFGEARFDFLDLTLEPPGAASWSIDRTTLREALERHKLGVVGHTAPYLPIVSPIEEIRAAAIVELRRCMDVFHALGACWMNIHPSLVPMQNRDFGVSRLVAILEEVMDLARGYSLGVMVENAPGLFNTAEQLGELLNPLPDLGLHLDVGHTNLMTPFNTVQEIVAAHGTRVKHVHCHDNKGGNMDLHLPLGAGTIDMRETIRTLKSCGYDGTITLEVFSRDRNYLLYSRDVVRRLWEGG